MLKKKHYKLTNKIKTNTEKYHFMCVIQYDICIFLCKKKEKLNYYTNTVVKKMLVNERKTNVLATQRNRGCGNFCWDTCYIYVLCYTRKYNIYIHFIKTYFITLIYININFYLHGRKKLGKFNKSLLFKSKFTSDFQGGAV